MIAAKVKIIAITVNYYIYKYFSQLNHAYNFNEVDQMNLKNHKLKNLSRMFMDNDRG